jgi:hypothetical protein
LFFNFLLIKLAPETIESFIFHPYFYLQRDPGSGAFSPPGSGIWIQDKKVRDSDPGSGIKHPGSATLAS